MACGCRHLGLGVPHIKKSFMSKVMKQAPGVDVVLLRRHFVVVRLAQWVVVASGKSRRSPPTVTRTRFTSALVGLMEATIWS